MAGTWTHLGGLGGHLGDDGGSLGGLGGAFAIHKAVIRALKVDVGGFWGDNWGHLADLVGQVGAKDAAKSQHDPSIPACSENVDFPSCF